MPELINPALREAEFRRCKTDLLYFLENYWKVLTVGKGYGPFELWPYQREDATDFAEVHRYADLMLAGDDIPPDLVRKLRQIRLKARQLGWTTLATGGVFWSAFFHDNHPWLVAAQGQEDASVTLKTQIKRPYEHLPKWMRDRGPQVVRDGAEDFDFDNGSRIRVIPATASAGRGDAMFGVLLDEAAFQDGAADLFAAVDPMCYGPLFMFSTANGMGNFFHETWNDSQLSDSIWEGKFRSCFERPGRTDDWYAGQVLKYRNQPHLLYQEYPRTAEEAFAKSGKTALPVDRIEQSQSFYPPEAVYDMAKVIGMASDEYHVDWPTMFEQARVPQGTADLELHVWRHPEVVRDEHGRLAYVPNYVVAADVAEGLEHGDYSTIAVIDVTTMEVVATAKAHFPLSTFSYAIEAVGYWYHNALVGPERNNHGMVPLIQLQERMYPRMFRMDSLAQIKTGDRSPRYGWHTGNATKPKLVTDMAEWLGDGDLQIHDERFLAEARVFLSNGKGGYGANAPNHDDLIMGVGISLQLALDEGQVEPFYYDPDPGPPTMGEVLQPMMEPTDEGVALSVPIGQGEVQAPAKRTFRLLA